MSSAPNEISAAGPSAVEAGAALPPLSVVDGSASDRALAAPAEPSFVIDRYCEMCFAPCALTDRGALCDTHYFDRTPLCDICGDEHSVVVEFGTRVCLKGRCLSQVRGGRSDAELARVADVVDAVASVFTAAILITEAGI